MAEVKVLIEGYVKELKDGWLAQPSTVLIKDSGLNIIVDPGSNKELLLKKFADEDLEPEDINMVFLTHHHLDHAIGMGIFPDSDILLDGDLMNINKSDKVFSYFGNIPKTNIGVIPTPGHIFEHSSLLVEAEMGKVAIAGDLFWWLDEEEQKTDIESLINHEDSNGAKDEKALRENRKKILEMADYIIPGHGKMFKVVK